MLKGQVKPIVEDDPSSADLSKAHSLLLEYPKDVVGDVDKMIEFGNNIIAIWKVEVQGLQVEKDLKKAGDVNINDKKLIRSQTINVAEKLKETLKKDVMNQRKSNNKSSENENDRTGLIRPALLSKKFDVNKTVATKLFGDNFFIKPDLKLAIFVMALYLVSGCFSFFAAWHFVPSYFVYSSIFCWPFLLYFYTVLYNIDVAIVVLRQQQTIIFFVWSFVFYACMLFEYRTQDNYVGYVMFLTVALFNFLMIPLFDCITNIHIRMICNKILHPGCFGVMIFHQMAMYFNWAEIPSSNDFPLFGHINMSMTALGSSALNNGIILIALNIFSAYTYPHSLIMVKSRVEAVVMSQDEAIALRAMDQIGNETAEANKQQDIVEVMTGKIINKLSSSLHWTGKVKDYEVPIDKEEK